MKKLVFSLLIFLFFHQTSFGQTFINGDFENNIVTTCSYNLSDTDFNTKISNVIAFGKTNYGGNYVGECDLLKTGCYVTPQSGNWCIGIANDYLTFTTSDAVAIELSSNLVPGNAYSLTFYLYGNTSFSSILTNVQVGESLTNSTVGIFIDTVAPIQNSWKLINLTFVAAQPSKYITVKNIPGTNSWNQIDNFTINNVIGISNSFERVSKVSVFPNPTSDFISIQTENASKFISATIRNSMGELLFVTDNPSIDFSQLQAGIYCLETTTDKGRFVMRILRK